MEVPHNKKKIYSLAVICFGIIVSVWLYSRESSGANIGKPSEVVTTVKNSDKIESNEEWQKILTKINSSNSTISLLKNADNYPEDNTLTSQLAKDLFSKYLLLSQNGRQPTEEELAKLVENILSSPIYTKSEGATYYESNIKTTNQNDRQTILEYNRVLSNKISTINKDEDVDPLKVFSSYINNSDPKQLEKLAPLVSRYQSIVNFLLNMTVPSELVSLHLDLLNSYSNLLSNTRDIKIVDTDPVRGLAGAGRYPLNIDSLRYTLAKINLYFQKKV